MSGFDAHVAATRAVGPAPVAPLPAPMNAVPMNAVPSNADARGRPLETATRNFFESRWGLDFSRVRIRDDGTAAEAARQVSARAFTRGETISFSHDGYGPQRPAGLRLLAHELAHVVQQRRRTGARDAVSQPSDVGEREAAAASAAIGWGTLEPWYAAVATERMTLPGVGGMKPQPVFSAAGAHVQRVQLTYDDGPDTAGNTRLVLDALNAAGARATFYLVGKRVAQGENWRVVFDMAAAGHWLGNHAFDWNDTTDNHIFLQGTVEERAEKILETEWAIRDALIRGQDSARTAKTWDAIPAANRTYIDDVIAHGTGRFRTPGFKSKAVRKPTLGDPNPVDQDGISTAAAIASASKVLVAVGLYPLKTTEPDVWGPDFEGVTVDPKDWEANRTKDQITSGVKAGLHGNADSILLHSRVGATAQATPAIVADIKARKFTFDPTAKGTLGAGAPQAGFAGLAAVSDPPTPAQIADARLWLKKRMSTMGPYLSGSVAVGIFELAQKAGPGEVSAFAAEIKATKVTVDGQDIPMANWMNANPEWRLFAGFYENWATRQPFPRQPSPPTH